MSKPNYPPWWNNHFRSEMWDTSWIMSHENWFSSTQMISLFFSHSQALEPMCPVGTAETWTDKLLTAFASPAALWVETWQGQVKTVRVQVHIVLYDMALKRRKSRAWEGRLRWALPEPDSCRFTRAVLGTCGALPESPESSPPAWCLTVYIYFPLSSFLPLQRSSSGSKRCVPGTGIQFSGTQFSWAPSEQRAWHKPQICMFYYVGFCVCVCVSYEMSWDTPTHFRRQPKRTGHIVPP